MRIQEAQKHTERDADPEDCYQPCCCRCFCCAVSGFLSRVPTDACIHDAAGVVALYGVPVFLESMFFQAS